MKIYGENITKVEFLKLLSLQMLPQFASSTCNDFSYYRMVSNSNDDKTEAKEDSGGVNTTK